MKANFKSGSVRGVRSNSHPYRDRRGRGHQLSTHDSGPRLRMTTTWKSLVLLPCEKGEHAKRRVGAPARKKPLTLAMPYGIVYSSEAKGAAHGEHSTSNGKCAKTSCLSTGVHPSSRSPTIPRVLPPERGRRPAGVRGRRLGICASGRLDRRTRRADRRPPRAES
jgi:hypothetical protein